MAGNVPGMLAALALQDAAWYGPATVTFLVQFPGDPNDPARNDVRVRFLGDKSQREERVATFDPVLGAWRATLYAKAGGSYRAILVRNGKEALVEPEEGIVELKYQRGLGLIVKGPREDRLHLDTGETWVGVGADLAEGATPERIDALADAGANWVRLASPSEDAMESVVRRDLAYTLALPEGADRRAVLARYGASPRLVSWEAAGLRDPWSRPTVSTASTWNTLFENRPGPFLVAPGDFSRVKALRSLLETSGWAEWKTPRVWKGAGAKGVAESDRLILVATPGAKLTGVPLADGTYLLTTLDPTTGESKTGETRVEHAALTLPLPGERFFVLRRKL